MNEENDYEQQKRQAEADTAIAKAKEAQAKADAEAANARKAAAEAAEAEAKVRTAEATANAAIAVAEQKAKADADKATADATKQTADAAKASAEARSSAATAATDEAKAGIPDVPKLPTISKPDDKSPTVADAGGAGIAEYTAAQALESVAHDVGIELVWALRAPGAPKALRYRDRRASTLGLSEDRWPPDFDTQGKTRTIWIMDSMTPSEAGIILLELRARLVTFKRQFDALLPADQTSDSSLTEQRKEDMLALLSDDLAIRGVAAGLPANALGLGGFAISTAAGLVNFGVELVGALRSKYALYNRKVSLNRQALLSATAAVLLGAGFKVRWPRFSSVNKSELIGDFAAACAARDELESRLPEKEPKNPEGKRVYTHAKTLIERFDTYATGIMSEPKAGGPSPFLEAALFEVSLPVADPTREDILLYADLSSQGADAMTGYGLARGTTAAFLGFAQVYFTATARDGALLWAGTSTVYTNGKLDMSSAEITATTSSRWHEPEWEEDEEE